MDLLRRKIAELEHQNRILEENYKSSAQGERQELLEKVAISEVKVNEASNQISLRDDEIFTLKKEIDSLRERVQLAYTEKEKQVEEMEQRIQIVQNETEEDKRMGETYLKEELRKSHEMNERLSATVRTLETQLAQSKKSASDMEAVMRNRLDEAERGISKYESEHRLTQDEFKKEVEEQKVEYERLLQEKEQQRQKQKNEWAEVQVWRKMHRFMGT